MGVLTRDIPIISQIPGNLRRQFNKEIILGKERHLDPEVIAKDLANQEEIKRSGNGKYWAIFTSGAGLFSDGYVNNGIGTSSTCLAILYGKEYTNSRAIQNVSSIAFVGAILGQFGFAYLSDVYSRKNAMLLGCVVMIVFSILCAGAWGVGTTKDHAGGLFAALTVYRFFLGVGIGSEYPCGSVAAAEAAALLPMGQRNRWFCWFTDFIIDFGFTMSAFVPLVLLWIFKEHNLDPVWRLTLGIGAIPPISLFFMRMKYKEGKKYQETKFNTHIPYWTVIKFYWFRLFIIFAIWFMYDFTAYAFGIYASYVLNIIIGSDDLYKTFGWNVVLNAFYLPGSFVGAFLADALGPRFGLALGVTLQGMIGYIMAGTFTSLVKNIGAFAICYGLFLSMGEMGPGCNLGLMASKTSGTPIRGHYYALAAMGGKLGGFVGTYIFPVLIREAGGSDSISGLQAPCWLSASMCMISAILAIFFLPDVDQESMDKEDEKFIEYLASTGFDVSTLGGGYARDSEVSFKSDEDEVIMSEKKDPQVTVREF